MLGIERGGIVITIDCRLEGHGRDACVSLQGDDADRYYDEWRDCVEIRLPPKNEEWGARTFDGIDPFGNTIFVMGPVSERNDLPRPSHIRASRTRHPLVTDPGDHFADSARSPCGRDQGSRSPDRPSS